MLQAVEAVVGVLFVDAVAHLGVELELLDKAVVGPAQRRDI